MKKILFLASIVALGVNPLYADILKDAADKIKGAAKKVDETVKSAGKDIATGAQVIADAIKEGADKIADQIAAGAEKAGITLPYSKANLGTLVLKSITNKECQDLITLGVALSVQTISFKAAQAALTSANDALKKLKAAGTTGTALNTANAAVQKAQEVYSTINGLRNKFQQALNDCLPEKK